jgi:ubiquinone/menaquinone biosynthesis C-methylase UbiE
MKTIPGSYNASSIHRDLDSEVERLQAQVLISWQKEARTLAQFGLHDGMSVLELGSGPGFFTQQLLAWLPNITVTSVEIDPLLVNRARQVTQGQFSERLHLVEASIMDMRLPNNSFDFAIARLLFQHLPDPIGAAREILNLLKPGGKLVIIDEDAEIQWTTEPLILELSSLLQKDSQFRASQGGNACVGRHLWRILQKAGFEKLNLEAVVFHSDELGIEAFLAQFDSDLLSSHIKAGFVTELERQNFLAAYETFLCANDPLIMGLWLMACGEKPQ